LSNGEPVPGISDILSGIGQTSNNVVNGFVNTTESNIGNQLVGGITNSLFGPLLQSTSAYQTGALPQLSVRNDPHLLIDWNIQMPSLTGFTTIPGQYIEGIHFASPSVGTKRIQWGSHHINMAGYMEVGNVSVTFFEDYQQTSGQYLNWWHTLIRNPDGSYNYPSDYCFPIIINGYAPDGVTIVSSIKLVGSFPEGPRGYPYSSGTAEYMKFDQSFAVDNIIFTFQGQSVSVNGSSGIINSLLNTVTGGLFSSAGNYLANTLGSGINSIEQGVGSAIGSLF
jgi:hypothetical protein